MRPGGVSHIEVKITRAVADAIAAERATFHNEAIDRAPFLTIHRVSSYPVFQTRDALEAAEHSGLVERVETKSHLPSEWWSLTAMGEAALDKEGANA